MPVNAALTERARGQAGFTLVEILLVIVLGTVVMLAGYGALDVFTADAGRQSKRLDATDNARRLVDQTVRDLRGASRVLVAEPTDLVYEVPVEGGVRVHRLCVAASAMRTSTTTAAPSALCSSLPESLPVRATSDTVFTYDGLVRSSSPNQIRNVGLTIALDGAHSGGRPAKSTLRASAARRSAGLPPITDQDIGTACTGPNGAPILSLAADLPGVGGLTVTYKDGTTGAVLGVTTGSGRVPIASTVTSVVVSITDGLGASRLLKTEIECI